MQRGRPGTQAPPLHCTPFLIMIIIKNDFDDDFDDDVDDDDVVDYFNNDFVIIRERFGEALFARIVGQGVMGHLGACSDRCFPDQDRHIVIIVVP